MNKGFSHYLRDSFRCSSYFFRRNFSRHVLWDLYIIADLLGLLFFLTRPIFIIADTRIGEAIANKRSFDIDGVFQGLFDGKRYLNILANCLINDLFIIAILAIFAIIPSAITIFAWFTPAISNALLNTIVISAYVPFMILAIIVLVAYLLNYEASSVAMARKDSNLGIGEARHNATRDLRKNRANRTQALLLLVYLFVILIHIVLAVMPAALFFLFGGLTGFIFGIAYVCISSVILLYYLPVIMASSFSSFVSLNIDVIALDEIDFTSYDPSKPLLDTSSVKAGRGEKTQPSSEANVGNTDDEMATNGQNSNSASYAEDGK